MIVVPSLERGKLQTPIIAHVYELVFRNYLMDVEHCAEIFEFKNKYKRGMLELI